jgi:hypothetical protein
VNAVVAVVTNTVDILVSLTYTRPEG